MGLFSWSEPPDEENGRCEEITEIKKTVAAFYESFNRRALTIEGCVTNLLKLYQIQNMDITNLRRELMSFATQYLNNPITEDSVLQTDLIYPSSEEIKKAFIFSKTPGSSEFYKTVIQPALRNLSHAVSFYVRLEDLFSAAGREYALYKTYLRDRYIDYLIYDETHIICAVIIPHTDLSENETEKYLDFLERLLSIFSIPLLYNPTVEELKEFLCKKEEA